MQLSGTPGGNSAKFVLNYDDQYNFGGDIVVNYYIKVPEVTEKVAALTDAEAELQALLTDYDPAKEIQKAISIEKTKVTDEKTEALV